MSWEPDPRHAEIMIEQMGLKEARSLKIPGVKEEKDSGRELRSDMDQIIGTSNNPDQNSIIETIESRAEPDTRRVSRCGQCQAKFDSHNDLFKHLDKEGHMNISDDKNIDHEHTNRVASERGRKKASRGDRRQRQLCIHQQQNI